jgi:hypothetical protein
VSKPVAGSFDIVVSCFDLDAFPRGVQATIEDSLEHRSTPDPRGFTTAIEVIPVEATVDRTLARTWGCAQGTEAAALQAGGGSPFYVVFD